jgi:hypothetical protein
MSASLTDLPPLSRENASTRSRHQSVHQHQRQDNHDKQKSGSSHRRSQSLDSPVRPSLATAMSVAAKTTFESLLPTGTSSTGSATAAAAAPAAAAADAAPAPAPTPIQSALEKLSPRSRAQWNRAKARFRQQLPEHPLSQRPNPGTLSSSAPADRLESTDFREEYRLHWSPDELWKTLEHIINRHANLKASERAGGGDASGSAVVGGTSGGTNSSSNSAASKMRRRSSVQNEKAVAPVPAPAAAAAAAGSSEADAVRGCLPLWAAHAVVICCAGVAALC